MYKIIIIKEEVVTKASGKDWAIIAQKQPTEGSGSVENVYGYTPEIGKEVEVEREILSQTVENLDLVEVIKAINGID